MWRWISGLAAVAVLLGGVRQAEAGPITYTEQATASGTLDGTPFTNALVTLTFAGNTANVTFNGVLFANFIGTTTVDVAGIGTDTFTHTVGVGDNQSNSIVGVFDFTRGRSVLDTTNSAFASYDLTTAIGPLSGESFITPSLTIPTNHGSFNLSTAGDSTFTATTQPSPVPEPATLTLLGIGISGLIGYGWRRRTLAAS